MTDKRGIHRSSGFLCCFFTEAKGDKFALHELWEEYVLGTGRNTNADRRLGTSGLGYS